MDKEEIKLLAPITDQIPEDTKGSAFAKAMADKKVDFFIEVALIFILGVLIGIAVKTEAAKRFTIGFNDYQMKAAPQNYDINKLEQDLISKQGSDNNANTQSLLLDEGGSAQ